MTAPPHTLVARPDDGETNPHRTDGAREDTNAVGAPLAVEVHGLRKRYGTLQVIDGLDLAVPRGELVALLGPNGAGKTTTVEILEGYR